MEQNIKIVSLTKDWHKYTHTHIYLTYGQKDLSSYLDVRCSLFVWYSFDIRLIFVWYSFDICLIFLSSFWYSMMQIFVTGISTNILQPVFRHMQAHTGPATPLNMLFNGYFKPNLQFYAIFHICLTVFSSTWLGSMVSGTRHYPGCSEPRSRHSHVLQISVWYSK